MTTIAAGSTPAGRAEASEDDGQNLWEKQEWHIIQETVQETVTDASLETAYCGSSHFFRFLLFLKELLWEWLCLDFNWRVAGCITKKWFSLVNDQILIFFFMVSSQNYYKTIISISISIKTEFCFEYVTWHNCWKCLYRASILDHTSV